MTKGYILSKLGEYTKNAFVVSLDIAVFGTNLNVVGLAKLDTGATGSSISLQSRSLDEL